MEKIDSKKIVDNGKKVFEGVKQKVVKVGGETIDNVKIKGGEFLDDTKKNMQINKLEEEIVEEKIKIGKVIFYKNIEIADSVIMEAKENIVKYKEMLVEKEKMRNKM